MSKVKDNIQTFNKRLEFSLEDLKAQYKHSSNGHTFTISSIYCEMNYMTLKDEKNHYWHFDLDNFFRMFYKI
jgi:hypothetical protein